MSGALQGKVMWLTLQPDSVGGFLMSLWTQMVQWVILPFLLVPGIGDRFCFYHFNVNYDQDGLS